MRWEEKLHFYAFAFTRKNVGETKKIASKYNDSQRKAILLQA